MCYLQYLRSDVVMVGFLYILNTVGVDLYIVSYKTYHAYKRFNYRVTEQYNLVQRFYAAQQVTSDTAVSK